MAGEDTRKLSGVLEMLSPDLDGGYPGEVCKAALSWICKICVFPCLCHLRKRHFSSLSLTFPL